MTETSHDLIVVGAGPAGAHAALAAAGAGLRVALFDEQRDAGGQVWRPPLANFEAGCRGKERRDGDALRSRLRASSVDARFGRRVWSIGRHFRLDALGPSGPESVTAPRLVTATGAHERIVPFPGWTLPGVIGLAGASALLESRGAVPARRVVVAGCGPLLVSVAARILAHGGEVKAVVDLSSRADWLALTPKLAGAPTQLARGLGWTTRIAAARIPVFHRHGVRRAEGTDALARIVIGPVDADRAPLSGEETVIEADTLAIGHGLVPGAEITRLFRARHRYDRLRGGVVPMLDPDGRSSVAGLYACGDGSGIFGVRIAAAAGRLAGLAAAVDAGVVKAGAEMEALRRVISRARPFADAVAGVMALRPAQVATMPMDTVVCRCEDVTRVEIEAAYAAGAKDGNQLKAFTRCGMGPCQGRMCGDVAAELLATEIGDREAVGFFTSRPPLRPVPFADIIGDFDYADIPIPEPAPL
jgi:NADPH-dependent 2,4-dienoyl-CoA reductase/sulfur reductase-like enzyme